MSIDDLARSPLRHYERPAGNGRVGRSDQHTLPPWTATPMLRGFV